MLPPDLLKRVRQIEFATRKLVTDVVSGTYKSQFKGHGMQFSEHRIYVPGDDVRHIDWKVSARSPETHLKKYEEERELAVFLVVDISGSTQFGTHRRLKGEVAAELGGMLAYAATHTGDKVGLLLFSEGIDLVVRPAKGRGHVQRIIRALLTFQLKNSKARTDLAGALNATARVMKQAGVVFVISDFQSEGYSKALQKLGRKHDVIALNITDSRETTVPALGLARLYDPETGNEAWVDTSSFRFKQWIKDYRAQVNREAAQAFKGPRVEELKINTREDYAESLVRFLRIRAQRKSRG